MEVTDIEFDAPIPDAIRTCQRFECFIGKVKRRRFGNGATWGFGILRRPSSGYAEMSTRPRANHFCRPGGDQSASGYRWWHENAAAFELLVDAQRGTLLRFAIIENGAEAFGQEVTDIEFDAPIPDAMFSFDPPPETEVQVALPSA